MRYIKIILFVLSTITNIYAQESERLLPGQQLPDLKFNNFLSTHLDSETFKLLSGKATVLDFGSTGCAPCIASLDKFQSLMSIYGEKLQVISVTAEKEERVRKFLKSNAIGKQLTIPIIYEDSVLHKLFPHLSTPHLVWVNKHGIIVAFTNHDYVTPAHIESFVNDEKLNWPVKWDFPLDVSKPLRVWNNQAGDLNLLPKHEISVFISSYIPGVQSKYFAAGDTVKGNARVLAVNQSIPELYLRTMGRSLRDKFMASQIVTKNFDGGSLVHNYLNGTQLGWMQDNAYSCEINYPVDLSKDWTGRKMRTYLDLYFSYSTNLMDTLRDVWLVSLGPDTLSMRRDAGAKGITLMKMIDMLNAVPNATPVLYLRGTHVRKMAPFTMDLDTKRFHDFEYLKNQLEKYGFQLRKSRRVMETLVIRKLQE
ncbi:MULTISPECIES: TlpA family protein disulfide reductase [Sphingobacterium]|uniref:TlpA family protein disulfide reductase n=1 Tax=Sphingobacterium TaxID=28453 RepID=UPI0013DCB57E|nr:MULTISPECIES: TlpA disulfide reductase family protein [unclassified Sphingobacterium]